LDRSQLVRNREITGLEGENPQGQPGSVDS